MYKRIDVPKPCRPQPTTSIQVFRIGEMTLYKEQTGPNNVCPLKMPLTSRWLTSDQLWPKTCPANLPSPCPLWMFEMWCINFMAQLNHDMHWKEMDFLICHQPLSKIVQTLKIFPSLKSTKYFCVDHNDQSCYSYQRHGEQKVCRE